MSRQIPSSTVLMMDTFQEGSCLLRAKARSPFSVSDKRMASHSGFQVLTLGEKHLDTHKKHAAFWEGKILQLWGSASQEISCFAFAYVNFWAFGTKTDLKNEDPFLYLEKGNILFLLCLRLNLEGIWGIFQCFLWMGTDTGYEIILFVITHFAMYFIMDIAVCEFVYFFPLQDAEHVLWTGSVPWQLPPDMIADDHQAPDLASSMYRPLGRPGCKGFLTVTHTHHQHCCGWAIPSI